MDESALHDKFATVAGLRLRYVEVGAGPALLLLHGGSLGSSADVFRRNLPPLAALGFRAIAFDQPGFGQSETPADHSNAYRRDSIMGLMDALAISRASLIAHSQAGGPALQVALKRPDRIDRLVVLGTGSLLPLLEDSNAPDTSAAQARLDRRMSVREPSVDDTRKLLEANLFHHDLITPEELALRHANSIGPCFSAFCERQRWAQEHPKEPGGAPLYRRLLELRTPPRMIFGKQDRAKAFERASLLKQLHPKLEVHIVDECKHLVPWDAADAFVRLTGEFLHRSEPRQN